MTINIPMFHLVFFCLIWSPVASLADSAIVVKKIGKVRILRAAKGDSVGATDANRVLVDGKIYFNLKASAGMKVEAGDMIRTGKNGRSRIIYENGDQFSIGTMSSFHIGTKQKKKKLTLSLLFGKVRGIIAKNGPRSEMEVLTSTMAMGVRGTDFYVMANGKGGGAEVTVLGGKIEVSSRRDPGYKTLVSAGQTLKIGNIAMNDVPRLNLRNITADDLIYIQRNSIFPRPRTMMALSSRPKNKKVVKAEVEAVKGFLEEHKDNHPEFYKKFISKVSSTNLDEVQDAFLKFLMKKSAEK